MRHRMAAVIACLTVWTILSTSPAKADDWRISRTTIDFGTVGVGLSRGGGLSIFATSSNPVTIQSMTLTGAGFQFATGVFPVTISQNGAQFSYSFNFVPTAVQSYTGTATFMINGQPVVITLFGTGAITTAVPTPSVTSLRFNVRQGNLSQSQTVQITNTGSEPLNILSVTTQAPFSTPSFRATSVAPGASASITVRYFGRNLGSTTGDLLITYDLLAPTGISLLGTTNTQVNFAITTYPALPLGTAGFPSLAQLTSAAGSGTVTYSLAPGSSLPSGLTLSSSGTISGAISSSATLTTYKFTINAGDAKSHKASETLTLTVLAPTGAACNDISWNIAGTSNPMIPISDLGTGNYFGTEGGLYGNGSNVPPAQHDSDGVAFAKAIQPLDANGNPDPNGKYVLLGLGISTLLYEWESFVPMASADAATNSHLVIVNGGEPTASATDFANLSSPFWGTLLNNIIPNARVTPKQVVALMFEDIDVFPTGTYPSDMVQLQGEFETIARNVLTQFPNVKLMYYAPRFYAGYSGTFDKSSPEPYAYEQGFAIQGAILDQINGSPSLNYNPANGAVVAPWLGWGAYTWANGLIARSDGLTYNCQDVLPDGRHPSKLYGASKVAAQILNFFKTNDTTMPWFLNNPPTSK